MTSASNTAGAPQSWNREAILDEIAASLRPRTTLAGIGVWARWHARRLATWPWGPYWTARNARSPLATAAPAPATGTSVTSATADARGDDAEIIALWGEIVRLTDIANHSDDDEAARLMLSISSMEHRVASLRATTPAAVAVKLRIAADVLSPNDTHSDELNLLSALDDVERMAALSGREALA